VLVKLAQMLRLFRDSQPAACDIIICALLHILFGTTLLFKIVQRGEQRTLLFGNTL